MRPGYVSSVATATFVILVNSHAASAQLPAQGGASNTFSENCATCHGNESVRVRRPSIS